MADSSRSQQPLPELVLMAARTLHHSPLCPFSRKVRIELTEKALEFQLQDTRPWDRTPEFMALNPAAEVPVLLEGKDTVIAESIAISEFIEESFPKRSLMGKTPMERAEVRRLVLWFDRKFYNEVTHNILFEKYFKHLRLEGEPYTEAIRAGKANILHHLDYIGHLTEQRDWLAGNHLTMADIAAAAQLSALDYFDDVPWGHNAGAKAWYALMKSRPSFRPVLEDRVPGYRPPAHYADVDF